MEWTTIKYICSVLFIIINCQCKNMHFANINVFIITFNTGRRIGNCIETSNSML